MVKSEKIPFGYIYRAINLVNGKNYVGQTVASRWRDGQNPIEERWKEEVGEAYRKEKRGENLRYVENAIIKYGPENFELKEQDVAYSQSELDAKETLWIKEYDTMNPDKGYNLKEGGLGGRLSELAKENLSKIGSDKWQNDQEYRDKQLEERRERAKDPAWLNKMTEVNQEINRNPETQAKISKSLINTWQNEEYQKNVSDGITQTWQDPSSRAKYLVSKKEGKREIEDKEQFLRDIQEMKKKDINAKYSMDGKDVNKRIEDMLGHKNVRTYSEAKKYLENKDIDEVLKEIRPSEKTPVRKDIANLEEFLEDIQKMHKKEVNEKYGLNGSTVNRKLSEMLGDRGVHTYTGAKNYLENNDIKEVVKDINERLNQDERHKGTTKILDKEEFLRDIQTMKKYEINHKYNMDGKTINSRIKDMFGAVGVKNYTELKQYLKDKNIDEVLKDLNEQNNDTFNYGDRADTIDEKELLKDIKHMQEKELYEKYGRVALDRRVQSLLGDEGVNNYREAKEYLKDKDVDKDGDLDIVSNSATLDTVDWFENLGNLIFAKHIISSNFGGPNSVFPIDIDNDGDVDIIGAALVANKISWFENNGFQKFTEHILTSNFYSASSCSAIDLNGDSKIDILTTAWSASDVVAWIQS